MKRPIVTVLILVVLTALAGYLAWLILPFWFKLGWLGRGVMCVLVGASVAGSWAYDRWQKGQIRRYLAGRERLTHEQFARQFFPPDQAKIAAKVREMLSPYVPADSSQIHPTDRFAEDLRVWSLDSLAGLELVLNLEREFHITLSKEDTRRFCTIADVVDCVASKLAGKQ